MIGISGLTAFILLLKDWTITHLLIQTMMIISIGLVASSRLQMKAHNLLEITVGFFVGSAAMMSLMTLWL